MSVYYIVIGLSLIFALLAKSSVVAYRSNQMYASTNYYRNNKICVVIVGMIFAFTSAFRYNVGTDFSNYYQYSKMLEWSNRLIENPFSEPGNGLIATLNVLYFPKKDGIYIIVAAIVTTFFIIRTIGKYSQNFALSVLLFVFTGIFTGSFNAVRQYLAAAILFSGYRYIVERKLGRWAMVVVIASSFHVTALLMFFVYFLVQKESSLRLFAFYAVIGTVLYYSYDRIFDLIELLKNSEVILTEYSTRSVKSARVLVQCVPLLLPIITGIDLINRDDESRVLFNIGMLNAVIALASSNSTYFSRFYIYTSIFQLLMYPDLFKKMRRTNQMILIMALLICYLFYWYYETSNSQALNDFQWVFSRWN